MKKRKINDVVRMERRALLAHYMGFFELEQELWEELEKEKSKTKNNMPICKG